MTPLKIISTIRKLNKSQWDLLLLSSNDANKSYSKRSKAFYQYLAKQYPAFETKYMKKEKIYAFIFPSKIYNDIIFRQTIAEAKEILHDYLIHISLIEDVSLQELLLLRSYRKIGAESLKLTEKSSNKGLIGEDYYMYQMILHAEKNKSKSIVAQSKSRKIDINLSQQFHSLEEYYLIERMKLSIDAINYKNILGQEHEVGNTEDLVKVVENLQTDNPLLDIYANILRCLLDFNDTKSYEALKISLMKEHERFHKNMCKYMFGMAQNFCIRNINAGRTEYLKEIFELFRFELKAGILFENEILATWDYKNIVTTALRLKEFEWTKDFIEKHKNRLDPSQRENAYTYNLAKYHFEIADYKNVLKGLVDVVYTDVFYHLDAMILLIKTYYLMDEIEAMFNVMDTLKIFIIRQKQLSKYQAQTYQNFMKYLKKISNTSVYDKARIEKIKEDISKEKVIADIGWLKNIIKELG